MMRTTVFFIVLLFFSGCASTPIKKEDSIPLGELRELVKKNCQDENERNNQQDMLSAVNRRLTHQLFLSTRDLYKHLGSLSAKNAMLELHQAQLEKEIRSLRIELVQLKKGRRK